MKKACVIGHFGFGKNLLNGQTVKTKIVASEVESVYGKENVLKIDTHGGIMALLRLPFQVFKAMRKCENILILPAHNGLRVLTPLLNFYKKLFKRKIHYLVIGGWISEYLKTKKGLAKKLKKFDCIYVETKTMQKSLNQMGFENVVVLPNCKELTLVSENEIEKVYSKPYRLCTFSRVMKEKGMEDAINVVKSINEEKGEIVCTLDIYGQVDASQIEWFHELENTFPSYVSYGGAVPFDKSVETLKDYYALLFPTRFYTEGIPGTIIDAYSAGIPVVSSKWESFDDIIEDGKTGLGYEFNDINDFKLKLETLFDLEIHKFKKECICKAKEYSVSAVMQTLFKKM